MKKKALLFSLAIISVIVFGVIVYFTYDDAREYLAEKDRESSTKKEIMNFTLKDISGQEVSLSDYKGKKVYLNFWATWCKPCMLEMPYINEINSEYEGIEIIAINLKEDKKTVEKYMNENSYEFKVLLDSDGKVANMYKAYSIPLSVLLDEEGNIIDAHMGTMKKDDLIKFMGLNDSQKKKVDKSEDAEEENSTLTVDKSEGEEGENFTLKDLSGREVSLSDFRGAKVYVHFWATWCDPCMAEMKDVAEINSEYDIEIITINSKEEESVVKQYIQSNGYKFRVLLDLNGEVSKQYKVQSVPVSILIDEKGKIINTHRGTMNKEQLIRFMQLD